MTGPAPTPTALRKLRGNPGGRKLNKAAEFDDVMPTCPRWLDKSARTEWHRVCKTLHRAGILKTTDRSALAAYCVAYARWQKFETVAKDFKSGVTKSESSGNYYLNPIFIAAQSAMKEMLATAAQMGMTPSARSRMVIDRPTSEPTLADILFESAK